MTAPSQPEAPAARQRVGAFVQAILHGDDEHRAWLIAAGKAWEEDKPLPEPNGKGSLEVARARIAELERELSKSKVLVAMFVDTAEYSDSYGVQGSDFTCCNYCQGGGAPNIPMDHAPECPVSKARSAAERWWEELTDETTRAYECEARADALARDKDALIAELAKVKGERL